MRLGGLNQLVDPIPGLRKFASTAHLLRTIAALAKKGKPVPNNLVQQTASKTKKSIGRLDTNVSTGAVTPRMAKTYGGVAGDLTPRFNSIGLSMDDIIDTRAALNLRSEFIKKLRMPYKPGRFNPPNPAPPKQTLWQWLNNQTPQNPRYKQMLKDVLEAQETLRHWGTAFSWIKNIKPGDAIQRIFPKRLLMGDLDDAARSSTGTFSNKLLLSKGDTTTPWSPMK